MGSGRLREPLAREYLQLNELWSKTDKNIISDNVRKYIGDNIPECQNSFNVLWDNLVEITGSTRYTVYAWLNRSRSNVKIPLLKLCMIADKLNVDIIEFLVDKSKKVENQNENVGKF